jgi:anti-sigma regulatory factor (Ser/Thr protein kinase)
MGSSDDERPSAPDAIVLNLGEHPPMLVTIRRWAAEALADLTGEELGDVLLVATELVTNAYEHGLFPREIRMMRIGEPCAIRIEVDDASARLPVLGHSTITPTRGRGLIVVDRLSKDWGVIPNIVGKTVWR